MVLAAFILNLLSSIGSGIALILYISNALTSRTMVLTGIIWSIICLTVSILMSVFSYQIYKGTRKNTLAIGIIDLIFGNLISGILLIVDYDQNKNNKDKSEKTEVEVIDAEKKE